MAWSIYRFNARLVTVVIMNISTRKCNDTFVVFTHAVILALAAMAKISPVIIDIPHKSHARCLRVFYLPNGCRTFTGLEGSSYEKYRRRRILFFGILRRLCSFIKLISVGDLRLTRFLFGIIPRLSLPERLVLSVMFKKAVMRPKLDDFAVIEDCYLIAEAAA